MEKKYTPKPQSKPQNREIPKPKDYEQKGHLIQKPTSQLNNNPKKNN